jgi:membrane protein
LPRRAERWQELLPGALLVALGSQAVSVAVVFYFAPRIGRYSELYGALGTAAVLLVWLYVVARLITGGAFLNATLWERRYGSTAPAGAESRLLE